MNTRLVFVSIVLFVWMPVCCSPPPKSVQFDTPALHQQSSSPGLRQLITTVYQLHSSPSLLVWLAPLTPCFCLYGWTNPPSTFFPPPTQSTTCKLFTPIQWSKATYSFKSCTEKKPCNYRFSGNCQLLSQKEWNSLEEGPLLSFWISCKQYVYLYKYYNIFRYRVVA